MMGREGVLGGDEVCRAQKMVAVYWGPHNHAGYEKNHNNQIDAAEFARLRPNCPLDSGGPD